MKRQNRIWAAQYKIRKGKEREGEHVLKEKKNQWLEVCRKTSVTKTSRQGQQKVPGAGLPRNYFLALWRLMKAHSQCRWESRPLLPQTPQSTFTLSHREALL